MFFLQHPFEGRDRNKPKKDGSDLLIESLNILISRFLDFGG